MFAKKYKPLFPTPQERYAMEMKIIEQQKIYGAKALIPRSYQTIHQATVADLINKLEMMEHPTLNIISNLKNFHLITHKPCCFFNTPSE